MKNPFEVLDARLINIESLLLDLKHNPKEAIPEDSAPDEKWFDLNELLTYLPDKLKKATVYGYVQQGSIPYHKRGNGKKLYFLKSEIDDWLKKGRHKTFAEVRAEADNYISKSKKGLNHE